MTANTRQRGHAFARLVDVMDRLLAPGGCPWDREQTLDSLRPYLLEETYEVLDVMTGDDPAAHREELGDLLMQIVFQAALREARGEFDIDDVATAIADKLVRRHPHVFGDARADDPEAVARQWDRIKAEERRAHGGGGPDRALRGVPRSTPALARAQKLSERAAAVGFDWPDAAGCRAKVDEELRELDEAIAAGDRARVEAELGDLLFAVTSLARKLGVDAEGALRAAADEFTRRFEHIEDRLHERGRSPRDATLDEMDALWEAAKKLAEK
ncbi:MAG: nucleoside triphosphate pyrophosphohydrolase [Deltaproteobacteria bacterium]|nr:MAG: nucleoside triphosphate pyrophosphohydrolase [Deltaproteobacteria bacterium]